MPRSRRACRDRGQAEEDDKIFEAKVKQCEDAVTLSEEVSAKFQASNAKRTDRILKQEGEDERVACGT